MSFSNRPSTVNLNLPPRKLVNLRGIQEGIRRFSFFLETCRPGSYPDPPLLAALLDLKSPVLARASLLLECASFVHRCNKGDWPEWIRSSSARQFSGFASNNPLGNRGTPSSTRRMHLIQRAAGRCFYQWGCQLSSRLCRIMETGGAVCHGVRPKKPDTHRRDLIIYDDLEDFFDEVYYNELRKQLRRLSKCSDSFSSSGIVNDESGERCPPALLFLACILLNEITAFLRETFQTIPLSRGNKSTLNTSNWEKLMSSRRWSILSNTFNPQQHQQTPTSVQSIVDVNPSIHQGDRRISLSTNDEESSRSSHEPPDENVSLGDKKGWRLTQGRQRLLRYGSPSNTASQPSDTMEKIHRTTRNLRSSKGVLNEDEKDGAADIGIKPFLKENLVLATGIVVSGSSGGSELKEARKQSNDTTASTEIGPKMNTATSVPSSTQGSTSRPNVSHYSQSQQNFDADEELMCKNLPWIKTAIDMANSFNLMCNHERVCHPWCFERVYRQCYRLTEALRKVYGEKLPAPGHLDKRKAMVDAWLNRQENIKKYTQRLSGYAINRRESAVVRQGAMLDRSSMALRTLLIEKLGELEENKEGRGRNISLQDSDEQIEMSQNPANTSPSPMLSYISTQVLCVAHAPFSTLLKSCLILRDEHFRDMLDICWYLLIHRDKHIVASVASFFIVSSVRNSEQTVGVIRRSLSSTDSKVRTEALRRFHALWRNRFHVWLKMDDGAQLVFKVPPPGIDFTLPSPPIGQSHITIADPPWMPHEKTKVEELCLKEEEQATSQTIMTMTRTRRKQKEEMVRRAVHESEEHESGLRQKFPLRATAIIQQAAYEPALFHHQPPQVIADSNGEECDMHVSSSRQQMPVAQPLFPSSILSVVPTIIEMLDDVKLDIFGKSVSDVAEKIIWSCIVEDPALFFRHFLEKITNRTRQAIHNLSNNFQEHLISLMRKMILRFQPLPCQTAYTLMNYFVRFALSSLQFGFVMHYVRTPCEGSDQAISAALSIAWLIAPHVHGLYFKDLKQTLKKEQCDQALMITANVPSAKKIIVHGPESGSGGIPSQFPIHEDTQFQQLLTDSLEFFNIHEKDVEYYFLIDTKTNSVHNPSSYVRDFYFFHRSFYPQLTLIKMNPDEAHFRMRQMAFIQKFIEVGKVLLTHSALVHSSENVIPQRIFFLHDEFTHLPSFPRKSLETCFGMYGGPFGRELYSMDNMHKFVWALLMSDMIEKMENAFMFGDLHLFINVINGITLLHCENFTILRRCMATYISMAIHFSTLFASEVIYTNDNGFEVNPMKVKAKYWFKLLHSMESMADTNDPIDILGLVNEAKPLKRLFFFSALLILVLDRTPVYFLRV
ncbi:unnamed protein product [Thelazia callipaeda]|uniref:UNC80 domain-containing protein n=1 Tax=Thelazia callipaeda TaxID=103827 RepID=A0A0N5D2X0_THECL|nr:unnamed protein product [Thelazia callipaeda]